MATKKKMLQAAAGSATGGGFTAIEDVFSTYLYTGNGSTQTITNGIDLAGEGGLVWLKSRSLDEANIVVDSERGPTFRLSTNSTTTQADNPSMVSAFTSDGFSLGNSNVTNTSGSTNVSWTFRKAPRFFDVVTYTGDGVNGRAIPHNLGCDVGSIFIKATSTGLSTNFWAVYHKETPTTFGILNSANAFASPNELYTMANIFGDNTVVTLPTSTEFTVAGNQPVNNSGTQYVAYLFAHDPLGPSGDGSDGLIDCGSYTGTGASEGPVINLGWEPQWVMIKSASSASQWILIDTMRGWTNSSANDPFLLANLSQQEFGNRYAKPLATGFQTGPSTGFNASGQTYIYIAIRRGPMRAPTSGTEVFKPLSALVTSNPQSFVTGFPADFIWSRRQNATSEQPGFVPKLTRRALYPNSTSAEVDASDPSGSFVAFDSNDRVTTGGYYSAGFGSVQSLVAFRRAPEFFDVVAYTGDGVAGRTVPHNLGVAPELIIAKPRDQARGWPTYWLPLGPTFSTYLNLTGLPTSGPNMWNSTNPSDTNFTVGNDADINASGFKYIAYLFSTLAGISKVGSYTGNGSSQTIDCGFTSGARFILIKRTDDNDNWYVWDTARGIVTGNDPHLSLNKTAAEITTDDSVDPDSSGFIVNQVAATNINVSSAPYIFYAIA